MRILALSRVLLRATNHAPSIWRQFHPVALLPLQVTWWTPSCAVDTCAESSQPKLYCFQLEERAHMSSSPREAAVYVSSKNQCTWCHGLPWARAEPSFQARRREPTPRSSSSSWPKSGCLQVTSWSRLEEAGCIWFSDQGARR